MKKEDNNPVETLNDIRNLMERSSKFISLSGFSGIIIGILTIICVSWYCNRYDINPLFLDYDYLATLPNEHFRVAVITSLGLMGTSIAVATIMTVRRARQMNVAVWGLASKRLFINMFIPLSIGVVFCQLMLIVHVDRVLPLSLVFYGMSLFNASNYTERSIRSLGLIEMLLGVICLAFIQYHILIWTIGFGLMHVLYGSYMYFKFEKH
jgi:hypothetical protein